MTDTVRTPTNLSKTTNPDATTPTKNSCGCCAPEQAIAPRTIAEGAVSAEYSVSRLTCGSRAGRVSKSIKALDCVQNVQIALVPDGTSTVSVTSNQPIDQASIQDAVEKAGYQLTTA